ncbi:MAG TPA: hypothetical protein ENF90_02650, partial [Candidatus Bathyarchaeota archaeon]|nr:hypothetical protein [Candidatus Bathyarchaeota archaeon]
MEKIIEEVSAIARNPKLLDIIISDLDKTVVHDYPCKISVLLTAASAYLNPINLFLRGESSIGKTYNVTETLKYFPEEDVWFLGRLSPTALIHERGVFVDKNGEEIDFLDAPRKDEFEDIKEYIAAKKHWEERIRNGYYKINLEGKILVFLEAPPLDTFNMLLPILSHDKKRISYRIAEKTGKGRLMTLHTIIEGWPATIFCTTSTRYLEDLATRCFTTTPKTTQEKFHDANLVTGRKNAYPWIYEEDEEAKRIGLFIENFKTWMNNFDGVVIPYAEFFSDIYFNEIGRDMRDLKNFFEMVKVITALHFYNRMHLEINDKKYIVSCLQDFYVAREIFFEIFETTRSGLSQDVLNFYYEILTTREKWEKKEAVEAYNKKFNTKKSSKQIYRYLKQLTEVGYVDEEDHESDKRKKVWIPLRMKKWTDHPFFEKAIFSNPKLQEAVEKWLEQLGHQSQKYNYKFTMWQWDDIGT